MGGAFLTRPRAEESLIDRLDRVLNPFIRQMFLRFDSFDSPQPEIYSRDGFARIGPCRFPSKSRVPRSI
jgi:hypothetical protein